MSVRSGRMNLMKSQLLEQVLRLPPHERIELIDAVWETLSPEDLPVSAEERTVLDARMLELEAHPEDQSPWSDAKLRLEQRRH